MKFDIVPNPNIDNVFNIVLSNFSNGEVFIEIIDSQGIMLYETSKKIETYKIEIPNNFTK